MLVITSELYDLTFEYILNRGEDVIHFARFVYDDRQIWNNIQMEKIMIKSMRRYVQMCNCCRR